ncbi:hypothetical protein [Methylobacterium radiotolerans]|jgi:hypothetical protein|uniref:hypothetical protein n=1 Tax=Methylobacterium radiotolerans TaxID=31998 RepID=UPI0038D19C99
MAKLDREASSSIPTSAMRIADHGRLAAAERSADTRSRCEVAMKKIEAEVERDGGLYRRNRGRITAAEVLYRAGLSKRLLQKPQNRDLKRDINAWVLGANTRIAKGTGTIRGEITDRVERSDDVARAIRQAWCEAELEYVEGRNEVARLTEENARLAAENAKLAAELAGRNVVPIKGGRT